MSRADVRPNETDILSAGVYNLGFLGLNFDCAAFLAWWSQRLLREAMIDVANMRFTDQRWMDFAPGYFDTYILKDETCNVAYWNADSRPLHWTGTHYEVNGQPLSFFHFSGFKPENPHLLSSHQSTNPRTRLSENSALARLCGEYAEKLAIAGYAQLKKLPYGWEKALGGLRVTMPMRLAYRSALRKHEDTGAPAPPSAFSDPMAFIAWLNEPLHPRRCPEITRYFWAIHAARPDLRAAFPNLLNHGAYYEWLRNHGRYEIPIPNELFPRAPGKAPAVTGADRIAAPVRGVTLTGYLRSEVGIGEAGRLMAAALEASGERTSKHVYSQSHSRQNHPWTDESRLFAPDYDTNLICINADQLPAFAEEAGPEFFQNRYNIGLWFWETELFPPTMHAGFNFLHEVWVTSEFAREAIAKVSPIPVFTFPLALNTGAPGPPPASRAALNLPDGFLFLFSFDFFSVAERKNPVGVIEAFQRAFLPGEGPTLVIKSINGDRNLAELERLHYARRDRSDIIIRDGYLTVAERDALAAACDCYVSLHRSEGFGLTIAEAMLLEKPTIATRYSGNLQFMTDLNSFLCGYRLRHVGHGFDPYPVDARWADPNLAEAAKLMRFVYEKPGEAQRRGKRGRLDLCARHDPRIVAEFIKGRLSELRQKPAAPVPFTAQNPERPLVTKVRAAVEQGVNVRRTVPSLLTWIFQGPRRAMKQFLRAYDQHHRRIGLSALNAFKEIDAEWSRERDLLSKRMCAQEDKIHVLKEELKEASQRLSAMEKELRGSPQALTSAQTNPGEGRGTSVKIEFIILAEAGILERQGLLLCESIRKFGGRYSQADITILQPRHERMISYCGRLRFQSLRAQVVEMSIVSPCPEYGTSYRALACGKYEPCSQADWLVFLDSDTVFLSEPDLELLQADVAVRPVDVKGMCTSGDGDPNDPYWRNLCHVCGVDYDSIPEVTTTVERARVKASYNGGLTVVKSETGLFAKTADFFLRSIAANLIPSPNNNIGFPAGHGVVSARGGRLWGSAQACCSLAIAALDLSVRILPPSQNFPLHSYHDLRPEIQKGAIPTISLVHYHHVFRGNPCDNPILTGQPGFPASSLEWLKERVGEFA
jgi:glycosyltransferase involved in cell wall biosynthesis